ncbi:MAG TPA: vWA domain-containing protein [Candidatus Nitrosocosmicus sp.]|nr:vWA domain-containing protein [Candidatus Nitrosocosmicus sp.]
MKIELQATPEAVALALIGAAIAIGLWAYLTRYSAVPAKRRGILLATRLLALLALLVASLAPVLRYPETSRARNRLLVLVDHSGSMDLRDLAGGRSRRAAADSAALAVAHELGGRYEVRTASFDAALGSYDKDASKALAYQGGGETALGDAIRFSFNRVDPDSVAAMLVLSDGVVNRGEDPEQALGAAVPLFGLTVGRHTDPPTVGIAGIETPPEIILGRPTPLVVSVRQGSRQESHGTVRVSEEGRVLGRTEFALHGAGGSVRVSVPVTLLERGKRFLTVDLVDVPDDPMRENKQRLVAVLARPAKRTIPVLASSWDWDLRSLARGIEEDTTRAVVRLTPSGSAQATAPGGAPRPFSSWLEDAEAVAVRYDSGTMTQERADALMRFLARGGGVLLWIDPTPRPPVESALTRALSIQWRLFGQPLGPIASTELAPAGRTQDVALLSGDAASAASIWKDLPPVEPILSLGTAGSPLQPIVIGRVGNEAIPIVLAGQVGKGRVVLLNAAGVYRWGITAAGLTGKPGIEGSFFGGAERWLAGGWEDRPVQITAPDITPEGRPIAIRVATTPPALGTGAEATVTAHPQGAAKGAKSETRTLTPGGPAGEFSGALGLPPGTYMLRGRVARAGRLVGTDSVRVAVGTQGIEYEELAADPTPLARLAERSGGTAAPLDSAGRVLDRLRSPDLVRVRLAEMDLFHNPLLFLVLIAALTLEWSLRRKFHLM